MKTQQIDIRKLKSNPANPRLIRDDKYKKLVNSIREFPEMLNIRPIVIDSDFTVLGGNMRLKACMDAGMDKVPVILADDLTDDQKRRFIIADNVGYGEWDWEVLANEWDAEELADWGLDVPTEWSEGAQAEAQEDDYEMPDEIVTDIVLGDLFEIGPHRLLCGDSTDSEAVGRLMNGEKADMVFTDPPYNVAFNGRSGKFDIIKNDDLPDSEFERLINEFASIVVILNPDCYYVWCNWKFYGILQSKLEFKACIVWAKNVFGLGSGYRHQHEFCLFNGKVDENINDESDLWEVKKDTNYQHPTQKPVALAARALSNHKKTKVVVDLFSGSGSTMVAAHQLNRKCYGMELDPKYCQVIIDRMLKLDPNIEIKRNGEPYVKTAQ